jgi:hypothetical protein
VLAAYFCKIYIQLAASQMQISFSRVQISISRMQISVSQLPTGSKFHSVGRRASRLQIAFGEWLSNKIPKFIYSLHAAGEQPNEICIWLADSRMQIMQK